MIPVYEAIDFIKIMDGGSTFPWQVFVNVDNKPNPYVVKLYKTNHIEQNYTILKEVLCSILAKEFDIQTPEPAFINFSQAFINTLPDEMQRTLSNVDSRMKFGTRLIQPPYTIFSDTLLNSTLKNYDLATIYAFDNLILNVDRRPEKPNLLIGEDSLFVIDHELTLSTYENTLNDFKNNDSWSHYYSNHVLFEYLKSMPTKSKNKAFDSFKYYLDTLVNIDNLDKFVQQTSSLDYKTDCYLSIKDYLCHIQQFSTKFINLLTSSIQ